MALNVDSGHLSALDAIIACKKIEEVIKNIKSQFQEYAVEEASKYEKTFTHMGCKITQMPGRKMYDFKHIEQWNKANDYKKEIENLAKKAATVKGEIVTENGEVIEKAIIKYTADTLKISV
jgi:uncharacterized protein YjgD (DUF1641 family)